MSLVRFRSNEGQPLVVSATHPLPVAISGESIQVNADVQIPSTINANITNTTPIAVIGPSNGNGQLGIVQLAASQLPLPVQIANYTSNTPVNVAVTDQPVQVAVAGTPTVNANIDGQPIRVKTDGDVLAVHLQSTSATALLKVLVTHGEGLLYAEWVYPEVTLTNTNEVIIDSVEFTPPLGDIEAFISWTVHGFVQNLPAGATLSIIVEARRLWSTNEGPWIKVYETDWNNEPFAFDARHYTQFRFRVRASQIGTPQPKVRFILIGNAFPLFAL